MPITKEKPKKVKRKGAKKTLKLKLTFNDSPWKESWGRKVNAEHVDMLCGDAFDEFCQKEFGATPDREHPITIEVVPSRSGRLTLKAIKSEPASQAYSYDVNDGHEYLNTIHYDCGELLERKIGVDTPFFIYVTAEWKQPD